MHSALLVTTEQSYFYEVDEKVVYLNLQADVGEEFPVVPFNLTAGTFAEGQLVPFNAPFERLSYLNGPDEDPLEEGGQWAKLDTSNVRAVRKVNLSGYEVAEANATGDAHVYWTPTMFGHDTEVAFQQWDAPAGSFMWLWLCVQNAGTPTPSGYRLEVEFVSGSGDTWRIQKVVAGVVTTLATQAWSTFNADWTVFRRVGNILTAYEAYYFYDTELDIDADNPEEEFYWRPEPPNYEVGFARYIHYPVLTVTDSTIISEGYVGFGVNHLVGVRNFYAGDAYGEKTDEDTVYLNLSTYGYEGIEGQPTFFTFEDLDAWQISWYEADTRPQHHAVISSIVAVDGTTSLRMKMDGDYPLSEFAMMWPDFVNGYDTTLDYWLTYAFYIESWESIEQGGLGGSFWLPGFLLQNDWENQEISATGPTLQPISQTTGQIGYLGSNVAVSAHQWHTVRMRFRATGTQRIVKLYVDGAVVYDATVADTFSTAPMGISMGQENGNCGGVVYIDAMEWSPGVEPTAPSISTDTGTGLSSKQWVRIRDQTNGASAVAYIDIWEINDTAVPDAWLYAEVFIPQEYLDQIPQNEYSAIFLETDAAEFYVHKQIFANPCKLEAYVYGTSTGSAKILLDPVIGDRWYTLEVHYLSNTLTEIWVDNQHFSYPITNPGSVADGTAWWAASRSEYVGATHSNRNRTAWFGFDNLAWDDRGRVTDQQFRNHWSFENKDALLEAQLNYPTIPFDAGLGPFNYEVSLEEGGFGPGPGLPVGVVYLTLSVSATEVVGGSTFGTAYLDLQAVTGTTYFDTPTIPLTISVLGGECYSTFTSEQFGSGEATLKWSSTDNDRWTDEEDLRWTGAPALADSIHC